MIGHPVIVPPLADPHLIKVGQQIHVEVEAVGEPGPFVEMVPAVQVHPTVGTVPIDDLPRPHQGEAIEGRVIDIHPVDLHVPHHPVEPGHIEIVQPTVGRGDHGEIRFTLEFPFVHEVVPGRYVFAFQVLLEPFIGTVRVDDGFGGITRTGEYHLAVKTVKRPELRQVLGQLAGSVVKFHSHASLMGFCHQLGQLCCVFIQIRIVDEGIKIFSMVNVDDIGAGSFGGGDLDRSVRAPAMEIAVAKLNRLVHRTERGEQQFKIIIQDFTRLHFTRTGVCIDNNVPVIQPDIYPAVAGIFPGGRQVQRSECVIDVDQRPPVILGLPLDPHPAVDRADPEHILIFGNVPLPLPVFCPRSTLMVESHHVLRFRSIHRDF